MLRGFRFGLVCTLLLTFGASAALHANNPFGAFVPVPNLSIPGKPIADLSLNGDDYLLLQTEVSGQPFTIQLWNPNDSIPLPLPPTITTNIQSGVAGMQTAQGPRVYLWGDFVVNGTPTRLIEWDGVDWGLPLGAVGGVVPASAQARMTNNGPELWIAGSTMFLPGIPGANAIGVYDGANWQTPGIVVGAVEEIVMVRESPNEDSVIVSGNDLISANGIALSGVARFNGNWDDLSGGFTGEIVAMNAFLDEADQLEIWVTGEGVGFTYNIGRYSNGNWETLSPVFAALEPEGLGRFYRLPTVFGDWRIAERVGLLQMSPFVEFLSPGVTSVAWNPTTGLFRPGSEASLNIVQYESTSGLFPTGSYLTSSTGEVLEWVAMEIEFIRGDANGDGTVNLADSITILETIFLGGDPFPCDNAADWNESGLINIADAILGLEYLFAGGPPPPAPFPQCGFDPTVVVYNCPVVPNCP